MRGPIRVQWLTPPEPGGNEGREIVRNHDIPVRIFGAALLHASVGVRYWADAPDNGPEGWGARVQLTFLLPE